MDKKKKRKSAYATMSMSQAVEQKRKTDEEDDRYEASLSEEVRAKREKSRKRSEEAAKAREEELKASSSHGEHWYDEILHSAKELGAAIKESASSLKASDFVDTWRMWNEGLGKLNVDEDIMGLYNQQQNKDHTEMIARYKDLLQKKQNYEKQLTEIDPNSRQADDIINQLNNINENIKNLDNYFLTDGKNNDVVVSSMFDTSKLSWSDRARLDWEYINKDVTPTTLDDYLHNPIGSAVLTATNILNLGAGSINYWQSLIGQGLNSIGIQSDHGLEERTASVLKTMDPNDPIIQKSYKGSNTNRFEIDSSIDSNIYGNIDENGKYIPGEWYKQYDRAQKETEAKYKADKQFLKDGKINLFGLLDDGIDIVDFEDINPQFRKEHEQYGSSFNDVIAHPLHGLVETNSTIGMMKYQIPAMVSDGIGAAIAKTVQAYALNGNPYGETINIMTNVITPSASLWGARKSRESETATEAIEAMTERVVNAVLENGANTTMIADLIARQAKAAGLDISDYVVTKNADGVNYYVPKDHQSLQELLKLGVAYNFATSDKIYEQAKSDSRKGINKLINANNALAVYDYVQTLPFLSFSGNAIKSVFAKDAMTDLQKTATMRGFGNTGRHTAAEKVKDFINGGALTKSLQILNSAQAPSIQGIADYAINKVAKKAIEKDIAKTLMARDAVKYAVSKAELIAGEGFVEGLEEVNQHLLSQRYQRGEYDNYNKEVSPFNLNEVVENIGLSFNGIGDLIGINTSDAENGDVELRKAFNIGFASSILFAGLSHAKGNLYNTQDSNIKSLFRLILQDRTIGKVFAEQQLSVQDLTHLGMYYDAMKKGGRSAQYMKERLLYLKDNIDKENSLVTEGFIDADMKLVDAMDAVLNNKFLNDIIDKTEFKKYVGKDGKKRMMMNAAKAVSDANTATDLIRSITEGADQKVNSMIRTVDQLLNSSGQINEELLNAFEKENPKLVSTINKILSTYNEYKKQVEQRYKEATYRYEDTSVYDDEQVHKLMQEYEKDKQSFIKNPAIISIAKNNTQFGDIRSIARELDNLYENEFESTIRRAHQIESKGYSQREFIFDRLNLFNLYQQKKAAEATMHLMEDQVRRQQEIQELTGLDIDINKIIGIRRASEEIYKSIENRLDHILGNDAIRKRNEDKKKNNQTDLELEYDISLIVNDYELDDQYDTLDDQQHIALATAMSRPLQLKKKMYLYGSANPITLRDMLMGENSYREIDEGAEEFARTMDQLRTSDILEMEVSERLKKIDTINKSGKIAARNFILREIHDMENRNYIANKRKLEETPVSPNDIEKAEEGDEAAATRINNYIDKTKESEKIDVSTQDENEKQSRGKFNGGKRKTNTEKKKEIEKARTNINKFKENANKEDGVTYDEDEDSEGSVIDETIDEIEIETPETAKKEFDEVLDNSDETPSVAENGDVELEEVEQTVNDDEQDDESNDSDDHAYDPTVTPEDMSSIDTVSSSEEIEESLIIDETTEGGEISQEAVEQVYIDEDENQNQFILGAEGVDDFGGISILDERTEDDDVMLIDASGELLDVEKTKDVKGELGLLLKADSGFMSQDELPGGNDLQNATNENLGGLINQTMFYEPTATEIPYLRVNGKDVKLPKPLGTGKELSEKLSKPGWIGSTKKYYIVTQSLEALNIKHVGDKSKDRMTVSMIIEDDEKCYAVFYRALGTTYSKKSDASGKVEKIFTNNAELKLRDELYVKNVDWSLLNEVFKKLTESQRVELEKEIGGSYPTNAPESTKQKAKIVKNVISIFAKEIARNEWVGLNGNDRQFERWWKGLKPSDYRLKENDPEYIEKREDRKNRISAAYQIARKNITKFGKTPISEESIEKQIELLRQNRNEIIEAYLDTKEDKNGNIQFVFPDEIRTNILPNTVHLSNGRINNNIDKETGRHIFGNIMPNMTATEIADEIESGRIEFGYGTGAFGASKFDIVELFKPYGERLVITNNDGYSLGKGLSGKIFVIVKSPNGTKVPVMLRESRFNTQTIVVGGKLKKIFLDGDNAWNDKKSNSKFVECFDIDVNTQMPKLKEGVDAKPSIAEVLFYMVCGKLGTLSNTFNAEYFIHNGKKTLIAGTDKFSQANSYFGPKQLYWGPILNGKPMEIEPGTENTIPRSQFGLIIGLPNEDGTYVQNTYSHDYLFNDSEESSNARRKIIRAIASQMHWSMDAFLLQEKSTSNDFAESFGSIVKEALRLNPGKEECSLYGCPELTFKRSEWESKEESGGVKFNKILYMAWCIKNEKLTTDVNMQNPLIDAFVFAHGVKQTPEKKVSDAAKAVGATENNPASVLKDQPIVSNYMINDVLWKNELFEEDYWKDQLGRDRKTVYNKLMNSAKKQKEDREKLFEKLNDRQKAKEHGGYEDIVVFRLSDKQKYNKPSEAIDYLKTKIKLFVDEYNNAADNTVKITYSDSQIDAIAPILNPNYGNRKSMPIMEIFKDGTTSITVRPITSNFMRADEGFTGIYSRIRGKGKMEEQRSRKWLLDKLGFEENQVIVINAILKSATNEEVFGLTNYATEALMNGLLNQGYMILSSQAGLGIEYHEAWHYVNLLLHDKAQRNAIYNSYIEHHSKFKKKGFTYNDVEEALAEDFRKYVLGLSDNSITGKIKRLFNNIMDFLFHTSDKKAYMQVFKAIQSGQYSKVELDQDSIKEFHERYDKRYGVPSKVHGIPGIDDKILDDMPSLISLNDLFEALEGCVNKIANVLNFDSIDKIKSYSGTNFESVVNIIRDLAGDQTDSHLQQVMNDIVDHPILIKHALQTYLMSIGVSFKIKRVPKTEEQTSVVGDQIELEGGEEEAIEKEDAPDNSWDKIDLSASHKDNAAIRAKMFLKRVPKYRRSYDGEMLPVVDKFGTPTFWDYSEVWNLIMNELWKSNTLDAKDENGEFLSTSIRGRVKKLARSNAMFYALDERFDEIEDDIQLRSQIFTTISASKNPVMLCLLKDPITNATTYEFGQEGFSDMDENYDSTDTEDTGAVADRTRIWELRNDSALQVALSVPRTWSQNATLNGLVNYNMKTGKSVISSKFADTIYAKKAKLVDKINKYKSQKQKAGVKKFTEDELREALYGADGIRNIFIDLCENLGIAVDEDVLDAYLTMYSDDNNTNRMQKQVNIFSQICSNANGTITTIVDNIVTNKGQESIRGKDGKNRQIDLLFNNYNSKSDIGKLAIAYNNIHPLLREYAVRDANDNLMYPINMPNELTDKTLNLMNPDSNDSASKMKKSPYCAHSVICQAAENVDPNQPGTELRLNTFAGLKDVNASLGADHAGLVALEDVLCKMFLTEADHIIFPTMADKKTWQSLYSSNIHLSHELIICSPKRADEMPFILEEYNKIKSYNEKEYKKKSEYENEAYNWYLDLPKENKIRLSIYNKAVQNTANRGQFSYKRFSDDTLSRFSYFFLDEINALIDYYSEEHISELVANPNARIANFDGKIENGRLDFSGNGGKFRYFYDTVLSDGMNLNLKMQALFELLKKIEKGEIKAKDDGSVHNTVTSFQAFGKKSEDCDGFEMIRSFLIDLRKNMFDKDGHFTPDMMDNMNMKLINMVEMAFEEISIPGDPLQLVKKDEVTGNYVPVRIPAQLLLRYVKMLDEKGVVENAIVYSQELTKDDVFAQILATYSLIANHTINTILSIMEVEKIYTGDSAMYKKKKNDYDPVSTVTLREIKIGNQIIDSFETEVENLNDTFSDKIKRLGGTQSPGNKLRLDYSESELAYDPTLKSTLYTVLNVEDIEIPSAHLEIIELNFKTQLVIDYIRSNDVPAFEKYVNEKIEARKQLNKQLKEEGKKGKAFLTRERVIDILYNDQDEVERVLNMLNDEGKEYVKVNLKSQMKPYQNITVADAQVFIRPALYRKMRIALGDNWTMEPDETGYSDEEAYRICESGDDWMNDPEKALLVKKFLLNALKMSYFQNSPFVTAGGKNINKAIYNKMALFPLFKFHRSTSVGRAIYERMNAEGNELDMIAFKSAVKVGAVLKTVTLHSEDGDISKINSKLGMIEKNGKMVPVCPNDNSVDYTTDQIRTNKSENTLAVSVQNLRNIRLQLNTHAHEADSRAIGTQMFKIAFSNIIDDAEYGTGKSGHLSRSGSVIKKDIMRCIFALTNLGVDEIRNRFYKKGSLDYGEVERYIQTIAINNGLGEIAQLLLAEGAVASGLMSRSVFEHGISSYVNKKVININTKGGTAIQQSVFGFVGHDASQVATQNGEDIESNNDRYQVYNGGKELNWYAEEGSMEVLLSLNFFKPVVPDNVWEKGYNARRQWLIDNDVIKGTKSDQTESHPKPFGVGYRIPTQGMSSMFSYIVADVLPEQVGDLIVVPREFTAQTGSDFDVDKLFLANFSYKKGKTESVLEDEKNEVTIGSLGNTLLLDYIDIISDRRNFGDSRASIDVITKTIQDTLLKPILKTKERGYRVGMSELLFGFLAKRKMEFGVGKTGIGSFALNITNLALTQYTHLTMDFGENPFELGTLDKIYGKDGLRISAWLSAMVNAHVDVAKDAYVFDLNVNQFTYNHANLLLRAGKGISTFIFLAQPSLKQLADKVNNAGGVYGKNIDGSQTDEEGKSKRKKRFELQIISNYRKQLERKLNSGLISDKNIAMVENAIEWCKINYPANKNERDEVNRIKREKDFKAPNAPFNLSDMFDFKQGAKCIIDLRESDNEDDIAKAIIHLIAAIVSFEVLDSYAQDLSQLVQCSQIDTKKFGNNIASQMNFENKYYTFRFNSTKWTINDKDFIKTVPIEDGEKEPKSADISYMALKKYFSETYLDKKFNTATKYTKGILQSQVFTATDAYSDIFKTFNGMLFGTNVVEAVDGSRRTLYGLIFKDETVLAIANSLDDLIRYTVFMTSGTETLERIRQRGNEDAIDFTEGNVAENMKRLIFGTNKEKSIFERTASLIKKVNKDPYAEEGYFELVDENGKVNNALLLYLNPQAPNDKFPIGRMLSTNNQMATDSSYKKKLMAAFDLLLSNDSEDIRKLAHDLAYYFYFSTYDQNTTNSFFDLVPPDYRKQYDMSLRHALRANKSIDGYSFITGQLGLNNVIEDQEESVKKDMVVKFVNNAVDIISRNYWYNDNIVLRFFPKVGNSVNGFNKLRGNVISDAIFDAVSGRMFSPWIATTMKDLMYFKVKKGSTTMLYRKVGIVNRKEVVTKDGKEIEYITSFNVYAVVPKAGIHKGKINQFEYYCNKNTPSIFEQNQIMSNKFAFDEVKKSIEEKILNSIPSENENVTIDLVWGDDIKVDDPMYISTNDDTYYSDADININEGAPTEKDEHVAYAIVKKSVSSANRAGSEYADHTINIVTNDRGADVNRSGSKVLPEIKSISDYGFDKLNVDRIISNIKKIGKQNITLFITSNFGEGGYQASANEIEDLRKRHIEEFKYSNQNERNLKSLTEKYEASLTDKKLSNEILQEKVFDFLNDLMFRLRSEGITVDHLSAPLIGNRAIPFAISRIHKVHVDAFEGRKAEIYPSNKYVKNRKSYNNFITKLSGLFDQSEISEQQEELTSVIDDVTTSIVELIENKAKSAVNRFAKYQSVDISTQDGEDNEKSESYSILDEVDESAENNINLEC